MSKNTYLRRCARISPLFGAGVWSAHIVAIRPTPLEVNWAVAILLLSPLVLVPLVLRLTAIPDGEGQHPLLWRLAVILQPLTALLLLAAFALPAGTNAALLTLPWLLTTVIISLFGLERLRRRGLQPLPELSIDSGLFFLFVGGAWTMASRLGIRPLDFDAVIVLLTGIHFHYAGLILPIFTGFAARRKPSLAGRLAALGVIGGVPLVATGITTTQLGYTPLIEAVSVWITALSGMLTAWLHLRLALDKEYSLPMRTLWFIVSFSLAASMVLAAMYGSRAYIDVEWLTIPWMRALHGTANCFGFALLGMIAWSIAAKREM